MKLFSPSVVSALALFWCAFSVDFPRTAGPIPQDAPGSRPSAERPTEPAKARAPAAPRPESRPTPQSEDVASPAALETALYDVISGPAGRKRDWVRFRSLFHPDARLMAVRVGPDGAPRPLSLTPAGYEAMAGAYLEREGFFERGVGRRVEAFGTVAHVFSTYESRHRAEDATPFARGINSIQMVRGADGWGVASLAWDEERPGQPLPADAPKAR